MGPIEDATSVHCKTQMRLGGTKTCRKAKTVQPGPEIVHDDFFTIKSLRRLDGRSR